MNEIEVKIHAEYSNYREKFYGLTLRQIIFGVLLVGVAVLTYIYSREYLGDDIASYLVILVSAPIGFLGFIPIQGLDAEKIIPYWWRNYMKFVKPLEYKTDKQILEEKNAMSKKYRYLEDGTVEKLSKAERREKAKILKEKKKQEKIEKKAKKNIKEVKQNIEEKDTSSIQSSSKKEIRQAKKEEKAKKKQEKMLLKAQKKFGINIEEQDKKDLEKEETSQVELVPPKDANNTIELEKPIEDEKIALSVEDRLLEENKDIIIKKNDNENLNNEPELKEVKDTEIELEKEIKKFEMFEKFKKIKPNATEEEFEKFYKWKEEN